MWNGNDFNAKLAESKRIKFDITHKNLKGGCLGADKIWRQIVTIEDAEEGGCDLFDIEELRGENSTDAFNNKYLCKWIDDANSVFNLATLMKCMVDTESWIDYKKDAAQPFGNRPVAIGYDPSRTRDNASLALLAIPLSPSDSWRLLKKDSWRGVNFQWQASRIKEEKDKHNVKHIGIDVSGIGRGVFELVEQFYRRVTPITYSVQTKTELVLKALDLIENGRFKYSAADKEVTQAFMMITQTVTGNGQITYSANRSNATGHADLAWSIMHGFNYEPLAPKRKSTVAFSD
jgi:phage terminase large subunit-like protein